MRVRDDDVLVVGAKGLEDFLKVHDICNEFQFLHVTNLVIESILHNSVFVSWLKNQLQKGIIEPQLHGYRHIDYDQLKLDEIKLDLEKSCEWFNNELEIKPTLWYTPWGSKSRKLIKAADSFGMKLKGNEKDAKLMGKNSVFDLLKAGKELDEILSPDKEIAVHWWKAIDKDRLEILGYVKLYGWNETIRKYPRLFDQWV